MTFSTSEREIPMSDVTIQDMVDFLNINPDATVGSVMGEFNLTRPEAQEVLDVTLRFLEYPPKYQRAALRFWEGGISEH